MPANKNSLLMHNTTFLSRFSLLIVSVLMSACNSLPHTASPQAMGSDSSEAQQLTSASVGSTVSLPAGNTLGASNVQIIDEYRAASGRLCRRVQVDAAANDSRVMCQRQNGQWSFTRALITSSLRRDIRPDGLTSMPLANGLPVTDGAVVDSASNVMSASVAGSAVEPAMASAEAAGSLPPVQLRLNPGETLWRFASRTTGNAENWSQIAELNGIGDVSKVRGGTMLNVPANLFKSSH